MDRAWLAGGLRLDDFITRAPRRPHPPGPARSRVPLEQKHSRDAGVTRALGSTDAALATSRAIASLATRGRVYLS